MWQYKGVLNFVKGIVQMNNVKTKVDCLMPLGMDEQQCCH